MESNGWLTLKGFDDGSLMDEAFAFNAGVPGSGRGRKRRTEEFMSSEDKAVEEMLGWKIGKLREELSKRGLDATGRRGELEERMEIAMRGKGKERESSSGSAASSSASSSSSSSSWRAGG